MKRILSLLAAAALLLSGCSPASSPVSEEPDEDLISVGVCQTGAESDWRVANSESIKATFTEENGYLAKKRAEGKHYNVALSHAAKKLVRLIFAMEKSRQPYCLVA